MAKFRLAKLLVIGVQWGPTREKDTHLAADRLAVWLLDRLERLQFRATWAVRDLESAWVPRLRGASVPQEVALDATELTPPAGPLGQGLGALLRQRVQQATEFGFGLRSLVVDPVGAESWQTMAALGFRTLRPSCERVTHFAHLVQPQPLRYGLWGLPVSIHWQQPGGWLRQVMQHQVAYSLRRAIQQDGCLHVVFDVTSLAQQMETAKRSVDRLLHTAARLRDQQHLQAARLVDIDRMLKAATVARPAESILRRAA
jgi:hypothetical protein